MALCACGCGEETKKSACLPGHDRRMVKRLEETVGGLSKLEALVKVAGLYSQDQVSLEDLGAAVKMLFPTQA